VDSDAQDLTGPEIVLLIEVLDAIIPFRDDARHVATEVERHRWQAHHLLRSKLKAAVHMSFYDRASGWLEAELARERQALTDKLASRLAELMREPGATRRSVREGFLAFARELRQSRQSTPRPLS
jgi:hypothetical protein